MNDFYKLDYNVNPFFHREKALAAYEKEKKKRRDKEESAREKFRDNIRQKYGIESKNSGENITKTNDKALQVLIHIIFVCFAGAQLEGCKGSF